MSSLLKKFTSDVSDIRSTRRDEDLNGFGRPREFIPQPQPSLARGSDSSRTNLCADVEVKGNITFRDYLRLDGKFEGELRSQGTLVIGENGIVKAEIQVGNLIVEGKIYGNVVASEKIDLRATAQLLGDIKASRLIINEGVVFVGKCDVKLSASAEQSTAGESSADNTESASPARHLS